MRLSVPPTKSALLALRRQLRFLVQGHEMLERKRELLTRVVHERLKQYRAQRRNAAEKLIEAYRWLAIAQIRMGAHMLRQSSVGLEPALAAQILPRSSVGVEYPSVTVEPLPLKPVALMGTDPSFDEARRHFAELAALLGRLGEAETALWRLLTEQRKTQKRVNALKYNIIPAYRERIRFIQSALEEEERNTLFQMKVLREQADRSDTPGSRG
ncbi:MAG: V-type ATP synthase subunit D [Betaproteobacteria bacterium]|nr:V-type ATP synthase subunit D [Betaproteobacteria bacterium]